MSPTLKTARPWCRENGRILVLDDMEERHDGFRIRFDDCEVVSAYTISEFIAALGTGKFSLICLDHDLGGHPKADLAGKRHLTGVDAAILLTTRPDEEAPDAILVHSWNPSGAMEMEAILKDHFRDRVVVRRRAFGA